MKHICLQENNYDCGLACIKMMLAHYHNNKEYISLNKDKINARYSLLELKKYAERYNLFLEGGKFDNKEDLFNYPNSMIQIEYLDLSHFVILFLRIKSYPHWYFINFVFKIEVIWNFSDNLLPNLFVLAFFLNK